MNILIGPREDLPLFMKYLPQSWQVSTWDSSANMHIVQDLGKMKMLITNGHMLSVLSVCWTSTGITSKEWKEIIRPQSIPYHSWRLPLSSWQAKLFLPKRSLVPQLHFNGLQSRSPPQGSSVDKDLSPSFWSMKCSQEQIKKCDVSRLPFVFTAFKISWGILASSKMHF